ncbi:hypothetical protein M135_3330 [Bacteroides fragilis str. S36L5]|uniref:Uncharacterized protein n=1 Tax=Bacteroides fragilis str. S36L11 TaxID=1339327 RepID=A0A016AHH8_BACFG|nr:hypothetical protein M136_2947 [Bacteroides fragilis str. S36L11]EYA84565.1 hypothetical protein M137_3696 [Bacteroides fragilis str. S36L12]EYA90179.1 hypothetical protein M135_3330 [Bacteroides fragilis str. S36L5]
MCKEKEFPMNFVPVKSIHLSLVEEKDKFFIIDPKIRNYHPIHD